MTNRILLTVGAAVLLFQAAAASAQDQFRLTVQATCRAANDAGRPVTYVLTDRDIVRACLTNNGIGATNIRQFKLVYNRGADSNGDLIQVVNATNNAVVCTAFKVLFQKSIPTGNGAHTERLAFLYNAIHSDAIGSTTIQEQIYFRADGSPSRTLLIGRMQFWDEVYHPDSICTGTFTARQP